MFISYQYLVVTPSFLMTSASLLGNDSISFFRQSLLLTLVTHSMMISLFYSSMLEQENSLSLNFIQAHTLLSLQRSMEPFFSILEKGLVVFAHMAESDWQMRSGFFYYIHCQDGISMPRTVKFCTEHPTKEENSIQFFSGSQLTGKSWSNQVQTGHVLLRRLYYPCSIF